jgi:hypothetical protein
MYGSQDLQVCIHECRVTAEDEVFVASLAATRDLKLLDLTHLLYEEHVTEFESPDMAVHMLLQSRLAFLDGILETGDWISRG